MEVHPWDSPRQPGARAPRGLPGILLRVRVLLLQLPELQK